MGKTSVTFAGVEFKNPIVMAAADHIHHYDQMIKAIDEGVGGIVLKTVMDIDYIIHRNKDLTEYTVLDADFNPVRKGKYPRGYTLFSRSGAFEATEDWWEMCEKVIKYAKEKDVRIIGSLWGEDPQWRLDTAKRMENMGCDLLEVNLGCPHFDVRNGDINDTFNDLKKIPELVNIPVVMKLSPDSAAIGNDIEFCKRLGYKGATITNRFPGFIPDIKTQQPILGLHAGCGGSWVSPLIMYKIYMGRLADPTFPIMGSNGCMNGDDLIRYILAGTPIVAMATAPLMEGIEIVGKMLKRLEAYMDENGVTDLNTLVGKATDNAQTLQERFDAKDHSKGHAKIDYDKCVNCKRCMQRCPWHGIVLDENGKVKVTVSPKLAHADGCIGCGLCVVNCPTGAITVEK